MPPLVLTVDTNVWVSAFLTPDGHAARLWPHWQEGRFEAVISPPLLAELAEVLERPRLQKRRKYSAEEVGAYLRLISELAQVVEVPGTLEICRDPDDDLLLETAIAGNATHVLSRDEDVIRDPAIPAFLDQHGIRAVTLRWLLSELQEAGA